MYVVGKSARDRCDKRGIDSEEDKEGSFSSRVEKVDEGQVQG